MGLNGDFHEVAKVWRQSSWQIRTYLALSAFLASGSIASLSETVFRWKGFVSDAGFFYQTYIAGQLQQLLKLLVVHVPNGLSHFLILTAIYLGANLRVSTFALPGAKARSVALRATADYVGVAIGITALLHFSARELEGEGALGLFIGSAFAASFSYWRVGGAARILWFASLLSPFAIVGLAAAVTSGLARTS
jgi:hypothetical protein